MHPIQNEMVTNQRHDIDLRRAQKRQALGIADATARAHRAGAHRLWPRRAALRTVRPEC